MALKALQAVEGPAFASAVVPLVVQGYSGKAVVQVYDRWGSLLAQRELEVEDGVPFQVRVPIPRGATAVRVKVLDASGNALLDQSVDVIQAQPAGAQAPSWVGGAQVVGGWEVLGGLPAAPAAMPPDYARLLEEYEQQAQQYQDLLAKLQDLENKVKQLLQQAG